MFNQGSIMTILTCRRAGLGPRTGSTGARHGAGPASRMHRANTLMECGLEWRVLNCLKDLLWTFGVASGFANSNRDQGRFPIE